jgi:2-C-methyl-D-erythritol 4-phosphate cytidylyltransferase
LLRRALETARQQQTLVTDEASAVEALGECPQLVSGRRDNLKITHPDDLALAAAIMLAQAVDTPGRA